MTVRVGNPFPLFLARSGLPLDGGNVYLGTDGADPQTSPVAAFFDLALTVAAPQPIRTIGGLMVRDGNPAMVYVAGASYSIRARDADGAEVLYLASAVLAGPAYQPLDADLTAIAALATTAYGRGVLPLADAAALRAYAGVTTPANPTESIIVAVSDETTALTAGTGKLTFRMPYAFTLSSVKASLTTAQVGGAIFTVNIKEAGVSILSTKLTLDNTEKTSVTAATPAVISDPALAADAEMTIDIDQIGDGTAKGLKVTLIGAKP